MALLENFEYSTFLYSNKLLGFVVSFHFRSISHIWAVVTVFNGTAAAQLVATLS